MDRYGDLVEAAFDEMPRILGIRQSAPIADEGDRAVAGGMGRCDVVGQSRSEGRFPAGEQDFCFIRIALDHSPNIVRRLAENMGATSPTVGFHAKDAVVVAGGADEDVKHRGSLVSTWVGEAEFRVCLGPTLAYWTSSLRGQR